MEDFTLIKQFIEQTENWKFQCKLMHWNTKNYHTHTLLDKLYFDLIEYQDNIVEDYLGITQYGISNIDSNTLAEDITPTEFIENIVTWLQLNFYGKIKDVPKYKGLISETDNFLHQLHKYHYFLTMT